MRSQFVFLELLLWAIEGYYIPGTYPREFKKAETLQVQVNSLKSFETELPFDYYSLPVCQPEDGVKRIADSVNPGTILMGLRIHNSPYQFRMMVQEKGKSACFNDQNSFGPLNTEGAEQLKTMIDQGYRVNMILDNMPVTTYDLEQAQQIVRPGFELGYEKEGRYYIYNHLVFNVLVHRTSGEYSKMGLGKGLGGSGYRKLLQTEEDEEQVWMVVGFEIMPCSIQRNFKEPIQNIACGSYPEATNPAAQEITEGAHIVYSYDVYFEKSKIEWVSRWDAYLGVPGGKVHWFSIINSVLVVVIMAAVVAVILMRTVRKDLAKYEEFLVESQPSAQELKEESGWKLIAGDVFRCPNNAESLSVYLGSGVQIVTSSAATIFFATLGFLSPAARGSLLSALLLLYLLLASIAGVVSVWVFGRMTGSYRGWRRLCIKVACFFPGIILLVTCVLNLFIMNTGTTGAIPAYYFFSLLFLWFITSIPLTYLGGYAVTRKDIEMPPVRTNQIPRHIPDPPFAANPYVLFIAAGLLPFGTLFIELYFAMSSVWQGFFYYLFGYLFIVAILTVVITVEVSILCTYVHLCVEHYQWWWRSFHRGGSVAVFVFIYAVSFLFTTLEDMEGVASLLVYFSYMSLIVLGLYIGAGTIGFLASYWFVLAIYSTIKSE